jgi:hypothetical protein
MRLVVLRFLRVQLAVVLASCFVLVTTGEKQILSFLVEMSKCFTLAGFVVLPNIFVFDFFLEKSLFSKEVVEPRGRKWHDQ